MNIRTLAIQHFLLICILLAGFHLAEAETNCSRRGVSVQILGSGGPEASDKRASSGYIIWHDGKARVLVDMGAGSLLRFEQSGASLVDLDMILLTHLHVDHSNDLPALIKASFFTDRRRNLPVYGPNRNQLMPSMTEFIHGLFGVNGAFRYLSSYLDGSESFRLLAQDIEASGKQAQPVITTKNVRVTAVPVHHGPIPSLAWRVEMAGKSMVFSGDMNNDNNTLTALASHADLLIAHHAIPESAGGVARNLHMPPGVIGKIAGGARVRQLVLSHRMTRTLGREQESTDIIRHYYQGPLHFAEDLQCFQP